MDAVKDGGLDLRKKLMSWVRVWRQRGTNECKQRHVVSLSKNGAHHPDAQQQPEKSTQVVGPENEQLNRVCALFHATQNPCLLLTPCTELTAAVGRGLRAQRLQLAG